MLFFFYLKKPKAKRIIDLHTNWKSVFISENKQKNSQTLTHNTELSFIFNRKGKANQYLNCSLSDEGILNLSEIESSKLYPHKFRVNQIKKKKIIINF